MDTDAIVEVFDSILNLDYIDVEQQVIFAQRKVEYLEEFAKDILLINRAIEELQKFTKMYNDRENKPFENMTDTLGNSINT